MLKSLSKLFQFFILFYRKHIAYFSKLYCVHITTDWQHGETEAVSVSYMLHLK